MILLKKIMNRFIQKQELNLNLKNFSFLNRDISRNNMSHIKLYKTLLTSSSYYTLRFRIFWIYGLFALSFIFFL